MVDTTRPILLINVVIKSLKRSHLFVESVGRGKKIPGSRTRTVGYRKLHYEFIFYLNSIR